MLRLIIVSCFIAVASLSSAQQPAASYQKQWDEIDSLIFKKNLTKTALTKVNAVYALAKKNEQDVVLIKCLLYRMYLQDRVTERNINANIAALQKESSEVKSGLSKSIIASFIAQKYQEYFQNNRWRFYQRSNTVQYKKDDIETWSSDDFNKAITHWYNESLSISDALKRADIDNFKPILTYYNTKAFRPSLYDLLAHRALMYFMTDETYINQPAYQFQMNDTAALGKIDVFTHHVFATKDTLSNKWKALLLFQELMRFHQSRKDTAALIDVNLQRIQYAKNNGVIEAEDSLYYDAVKENTELFASSRYVAQAWYLLAEWHSTRAATYNPPGDTTKRWEYLKALEICNKFLPLKDSTEGHYNLYNLYHEILKMHISIITEQVNVPNLPFRAFVEYSNVSKLHWKVIKVTRGIDDLLKKAEKKYGFLADFKVAHSLPFVAQQQVDLPATGDYQKHSVEIKIDGLPSGKYLLVSSSSPTFSDTAKLTLSTFYISGISYVSNSENYFVLDRTTGEPLKQATVRVWEQQYDGGYGTNGGYKDVATDTYTTDANGYFRVKTKKNEGRSVKLQIKHGGDELFMDNGQYVQPLSYSRGEDEQYKNDEEYEAKNSRVFFFRDRSIYRPGQTVYFKLLMLTKDRKTSRTKLITRLNPGDSFYVRLQDVNDKVLDSLLLIPNEFGSFAGTFKLPVNALTGNFSLSTTYLGTDAGGDFSVEEYKRPTFYVQLEKPKTAYRINDSITVTCTAKAYSGNTVDGAAIKYNVTRRSRLLYSWRWEGGYYPQSSPTAITFGEAVTDANGKFTITFKALPDESISKDLLPIFDFEVVANVTDRAGETRSSTTNLSIGYHSLNVQLTLPETAEADSFKSVRVNTTNIEGDKQPSTVKVTIYSLQPPKKLIRERYWQQPDQYIFSEEQYRQLFPYDEYKNETEKSRWVKNLVYSTTVNTAETGKADIPAGKLKAGWYLIEAIATNKDGRDIKDIGYTQLYSRSEGSFDGDYLFTVANNTSTQPGMPASILIGSGADNVHLIEEIQRQTDANDEEFHRDFSFHKVDKEVKEFSVTPTLKDVGGIGVNFLFVKNNRFFTYGTTIQVEEPVDSLHVEVLTYRDKLEPGKQEKWTLKITGKNNEAAAAEVLTSMYDASLDQFKPHEWELPGDDRGYFALVEWQKDENFSSGTSREHAGFSSPKYFNKRYPEIDFFLSKGRRRAMLRSVPRYDTIPVYDMEGEVKRYEIRDRWAEDDGEVSLQAYAGGGGRMGAVGGRMPAMADSRNFADEAAAPMAMAQTSTAGLDEVVVTGFGAKLKADKKVEFTKFTPPRVMGDEAVKEQSEPPLQLRTNFNETAFFFPQLTTAQDGSLSFTFTLPDALTQWKWQIFAHDKLARFGFAQRTIVSQKTLMVQANAPRFMREGDKMEFSAKVSNLSEKELKSNATLELVDAVTLQPINDLLSNTTAKQSFTAQAGQSAAVKFSIAIPTDFNKPITWRIVARAGQFADGEENTLPVLTNRMLVTESLPLYMRNTPQKHFEFTKLKTNKSTTSQHHAVTVEYTSNPAWYALQSLPYLLEYPYECSEQTFNRFFANALASKIMNSNPRMRQVFDEWKKDTAALKSNLQKNEELKSLLIQETPWLLEAESEEERKHNLAMLLDAVTIVQSSQRNINKLKQMQMQSGGFPWFQGGREDRYITQYIVTGIGRLQHMNGIPAELVDELNRIAVRALLYLDNEVSNDYKSLKKYHANMKANNTGAIQFQYLYMRSFFGKSFPVVKDKEAYDYFYAQAKKYWLDQYNYFQAMIGEFLYRTGEAGFVNQNILPALLENAVVNEDAGMYWKGKEFGWFWYQAPVEQQALMIEFVSEVQAHEKEDYLLQKINDMKTWLLRQKQTTNWRTTKATADACYALLMNGSDWLSTPREAEVKLGDDVVSDTSNKEAGTGYFKRRIEGDKVTPQMADITVTMEHASGSNATSPAWGAVYWQYFENLDKITPASTPLLINKKLFVEKNTDRGAVLQPVNDGDAMKVGDKVKIRIEIKVDREMEYVHLKDMRAASMEPVNVLSSYKWQDGLGYYESTRDASTNFFISYLPRGTYVFEYPVTITHEGDFSVGVATAQCMYAPEFNSHSEGVRVVVK